MEKKRILVLCTGNSCRSQMAEGYLRLFAGDRAEVYSAGVEAHGLNPSAVKTMAEDGVDISAHTSNVVDEYVSIPFDFVITVCDNARERCPFFPSTAKRFHYDFPDPAKAVGTTEEVNNKFREVRELIKTYCRKFVDENFPAVIRAATINDAGAIARIYNHYVLNTTVTFEEEPVSVKTMEERIAEVTPKYPWLVLEAGGRIRGFAYAGAWKSRCAYRYSVECTVYLDTETTGRRCGTLLYGELLKRLTGLGLHGVIGGIALPNAPCIALHEKFGFEKVAHFKEVGHKFGRWIDVVYYEKLLHSLEKKPGIP